MYSKPRCLTCLAQFLSSVLAVCCLQATSAAAAESLPLPDSFRAQVEVSQAGYGSVVVVWSRPSRPDEPTTFTITYRDSHGVDVMVHPNPSLIPGLFNAINSAPKAIDLRKLPDHREVDPDVRAYSRNAKRGKLIVGHLDLSGYQITASDTMHPAEYQWIEKLYENLVTRVVGRKTGDYYMPVDLAARAKAPPLRVEPPAPREERSKPDPSSKPDGAAIEGDPVPLQADKVIECPDFIRARHGARFGTKIVFREFTPAQVKAMGLSAGNSRLLVATAPGARLENDASAGAVVVLDPSDKKRSTRWDPTEKASVYREGRLVEESFTEMGFGYELSFSPDGRWCIIGTARGGKAFLRNLDSNRQTTLTHSLFQGHSLIGGKWLPDNPENSPWRRDRNAGATGAFCSATDFFLFGEGENQGTLMFVGSTQQPGQLFPKSKPSQAADPLRARDAEIRAARTGYIENRLHGCNGTGDGRLLLSLGQLYRHSGDHASLVNARPLRPTGADPAVERREGNAWVTDSTRPTKGPAIKGDACYTLVTAVRSGRPWTFFAVGDVTEPDKRRIEISNTPTGEFYRGVACGVFSHKGRDILWAAVRAAAPTTGPDRLVLADSESGKLAVILPQDTTGKTLMFCDDVSAAIDEQKLILYMGDTRIAADERAKRRGSTGAVFAYDITHLIPD